LLSIPPPLIELTDAQRRRRRRFNVGRVLVLNTPPAWSLSEAAATSRGSRSSEAARVETVSRTASP